MTILPPFTIQQITILLTISATIFLTSCAGEKSNELKGSNSIQLSGAVADGYLTGAKVCLDTNDNYACDADEPTTISGEKGVYTLGKIDTKIASNHSIIVEVSTSTTDEDTGKTIPVPYKLSSPTQSHHFISPITTMVNSSLKTKAVTLDEAKKLVTEKLLGIDPALAIDPLADYIEKKSSNDSNNSYENTHLVAQAVAQIIANNAKRLNSILGNDATIENQALTQILSNNKAEKNLQQISHVVLNSQNAAALTTSINSFSSHLINVKDKNQLREDLAEIKRQQAIAKVSKKIQPSEFIDLNIQTYEIVYRSNEYHIYSFALYNNFVYGDKKAINKSSLIFDNIPKNEHHRGIGYSLKNNKIAVEFNNSQLAKTNHFKEVNLTGQTLKLKSIATRDRDDQWKTGDENKIVSFSEGDKLYIFPFFYLTKPVPTTEEISFTSICSNNIKACEIGYLNGEDSIASYLAGLPKANSKRHVNCKHESVEATCKMLGWYSEDNKTIHYCTTNDDRTSCVPGTEATFKSYLRHETNLNDPFYGNYELLTRIDIGEYVKGEGLKLLVAYDNGQSNQLLQMRWGIYLSGFETERSILNESAIKKVLSALK